MTDIADTMSRGLSPGETARLLMYPYDIKGLWSGRLSGAEAQGMDPQNRVLLEQAALALSDAAAVVGTLTDTRTGVYIGCMYQVRSGATCQALCTIG